MFFLYPQPPQQHRVLFVATAKHCAYKYSIFSRAIISRGALARVADVCAKSLHETTQKIRGEKYNYIVF